MISFLIIRNMSITIIHTRVLLQTCLIALFVTYHSYLLYVHMTYVLHNHSDLRWLYACGVPLVLAVIVSRIQSTIPVIINRCMLSVTLYNMFLLWSPPLLYIIVLIIHSLHLVVAMFCFRSDLICPSKLLIMVCNSCVWLHVSLSPNTMNLHVRFQFYSSLLPLCSRTSTNWMTTRL